MKSDGSWVYMFCLVISRQHMPVHVKTVSSWIRKVLSIAKAYMSLCTLSGAVASAALGGWCLLMSLLQAGD